MTTPTSIPAIQAPRFQTSPDGLSVPKSCPFCRGEAAVNTIQWSAEHLAEQGLPEGIRFGVNCMRCGVNNRGGNGAATPDEAIARWNKRAEPVAIAALLAGTQRLEADLAALVTEGRKVALAFHDWPAYISDFANGERRRALDDFVVALVRTVARKTKAKEGA